MPRRDVAILPTDDDPCDAKTTEQKAENAEQAEASHDAADAFADPASNPSHAAAHRAFLARYLKANARHLSVTESAVLNAEIAAASECEVAHSAPVKAGAESQASAAVTAEETVSS